MLSKIQGVLVEAGDLISINVHGLTLDLFVSRYTKSQLPQFGSTVSLFTHLVIRENEWLLFGFYLAVERSLFRQLISVSGVGPKLALAILSGYEVPVLATHIEKKNILALSSISGIGKKVAERIALELHGKLFAISQEQVDVQGENAHDAIRALVGLGIRLSEATKKIKSIPNYQQLSLEELIREGLQK
ncbi:MAG: Holliday junction branch migration protein RuvA [Methylacidiphilales bacterium]|nr:Holliday junction branch migration protein RuvA [Candidatus Methylacidiphilales bacterium]